LRGKEIKMDDLDNMLAQLQNTVDQCLPERGSSKELLSQLETIGLELGDISISQKPRNRKIPKFPAPKKDIIYSAETIKEAKTCVICQEPILTGGAILSGKYYHNEHFECNVCSMSLKNEITLEKDGLLWCERDFHLKFSPSCAYCHDPIINVK
jgi:hypothetical protein